MRRHFIARMFIAAMLICGLFWLLTISSQARQKEVYCAWTRGVTEQRVDDADRVLLPVGNGSSEHIIKVHLPFGMPRNSSDKHGEMLLVQEHYIIWYDSDLRAPLWTAHLLTEVDLSQNRTRLESFRSDPRLGEGQRSECRDYKEPIFDQGHMVPNADMLRSDQAMDNSYLLSNMTPQHCAFNRGVWQVLEDRVRKWVREAKKIWVITGAIYDRVPPVGRDPDADAWRMTGTMGARVAIPSSLYKVLVRQSGSGYETLSIDLPNDDTLLERGRIPDYIAGHVTTLDAIAQKSGFRFLESQNVNEWSVLWPATANWGSPITGGCRQPILRGNSVNSGSESSRKSP